MLIAMIAAFLALALLAQPAIQIAPGSQTPAERLEARLNALETADAAAAIALEDEILALWADPGSATVALMMDRGAGAYSEQDYERAARMYRHVNELAPDFTEGWIASARAAMGRQDYAFALEALDTAITLEPRRFDAYTALAGVLERAEALDAALEAYDAALAVNPHYAPARNAANRLRLRLAGRPL